MFMGQRELNNMKHFSALINKKFTLEQRLTVYYNNLLFTRLAKETLVTMGLKHASLQSIARGLISFQAKLFTSKPKF